MSLMEFSDEAPRFEEMRKVVELYIQNVNPSKIAKELGIRRVDVLAHVEDWKRTAVGMEVMKDRVEELIASMDEHYSLLIRKAYEIVEEVDALDNEEDDNLNKKNGRQTMTRSQMLSQKLSALKAIGEWESKRIDILQKSGLLEAADIGDQLAEMEAELEKVLEILDEELCNHCRPKIMGRLVKTGETVVVVSE